MTQTWFRVSALALALGFVVPAHAVEQVDEQTRGQIDQLMKSFNSHYGDHDEAGITTLFTDDAVIMSPSPTVVKTGRQEIKQFVQSLFDMTAHLEGSIDKVSPLRDTSNDTMIVLGKYHVTGYSLGGTFNVVGHWAAVDVRVGDTWRIRLLTVLPDVPSPPTR